MAPRWRWPTSSSLTTPLATLMLASGPLDATIARKCSEVFEEAASSSLNSYSFMRCFGLNLPLLFAQKLHQRASEKTKDYSGLLNCTRCISSLTFSSRTPFT